MPKEFKIKRARPHLTNKPKGKAIYYRPDRERKKGRRLYWTSVKIEQLADVMVKWFEENPLKVSLGSFCWQHKIPACYLARFAARNSYFDYNLQVIKSLLESRLLELGLAGEIDKVMAIFSLKNISGWRDKREINNNVEITSKVVELQLPKKRDVIEVNAEIIEAKKLGKPK